MKTVHIERNDLFKGFQMILCNNILRADEAFFEDNMELFYSPCEECKDKTEEEAENCEECAGEGQYETEAYQYFIVDPDEYQRKDLESFGVELGYSEALDCHIMPIYDFGTSWRMFSYSKEVEDDYTLGHNETLKRTTVY